MIKQLKLVHYNEFTLEPNDLKLDSKMNLDDKNAHYSKLQNEIDHYKNLLIDNDIFLENLKKKLSDVNLKPVEEAIRSCQTYADNISNQIDKLQNSLKDLNRNLIELGCLQELKANDAIGALNELKTEYEQKLDQLIDELVGLVKANLDELKNKDEKMDSLKDVELQLINLDQLSNKFEAKVNKLNIQESPNVLQIQNDLNDFKKQLNDKYEDLKEKEIKKLKEEERRIKEAEAEKLRKLEDQRKKEEEERLNKLKEDEDRRLREEADKLRKLEEQRQIEEDRLRKLEEQRKKEEERLNKLKEEEAEAEKLKKLEEQMQKDAREEKLKRKRLEKERQLQQEDDFSSANNLSKVIDEKDDNDMNKKKLKKVINNTSNKQIPSNFDYEDEEEPIAVVQVRMPQKSKALLTNTSRMYSVEHYSELEDSIDGAYEPIIELADSDTELQNYQTNYQSTIDNSVLEEIREMLKELKDNQMNTANLANLINEMNSIKNICRKVEDVRNSKENANNNLGDQLKLINSQLNDIFNAIKDILNSYIPNLQDSIPNDDSNNQPEQQLMDSINLYTEIVTEFDKFDNLVNNNNDFINEIKNQLRRIDNKSIDNKLIDYRDLLDKINSQINNVSNEINSMNDNLQDLKYKDNLDDRSTLAELEKLRKLCEDHFDNIIEDLYISYIPKLNSLDSYLNETKELKELDSILESMIELKEEIDEKVNKLDLNSSPLIKNLLDLVEKLKNKIEAKIEDTICKRTMADDLKDNLINEQLEQTMLEKEKEDKIKKRPLNDLNYGEQNKMEFTVQQTPDTFQTAAAENVNAIFKQQPALSNVSNLKESQMSSSPFSKLNKQASSEADQALEQILSELKRLKNSLNSPTKLDYEKISFKMTNLIDLISSIQSINEQKPSAAKLKEVTSELNQVVDCLSKITRDYIKEVCKKENTRPDNLIGDKLINNNLDQLLNKLKPRFESITEYRKFEKLTEDNQEKVDALNKMINQLTALPINEKVQNLKV